MKKIKKFIKKNYVGILLAIFFIAYFFYLFDSFPKTCLKYPVINYDYSIHYTESLDSYSFFNSEHRIWGYSPYHFAGYPAGIFQAVDNHWAFLFQIILSELFGHALTFNLSIFAGFLILPWLAFYTARNFNISKINSVCFFVLSIVFIIGNYWMKWFFTAGMYGFYIAIFFSFYTSSLFFSYITTKKSNVLIKLIFWGALTLFVHPLSSVICIILCAPLGILYFKKIKLKEVYKILGVLFIILFLNLPWIIPFLNFHELNAGFGHYFQTSPSKLMEFSKSVILIFFVASYLKAKKEKNLKFTKSILISCIILILLSFLGSQLGFSKIEPERFQAPLELGILLLGSTLFESSIKRKDIFYFAIILILIISPTSAMAPSSTPIKYHCGYYSEDDKIIFDFFKNNVSDNVRVHIQDSSGGKFASHYFTSFLPVLTSKETLAGVHGFPAESFTFTQFLGNQIFGKNITSMSEEEFKKYAELYNLKYFMIFSNESILFFENLSGFSKVLEKEGYFIYEYTELNETFCYKCNADIRATYNEINVMGATSNTTILKYHYIKTLKISPSNLNIQQVYLLDDPNPFILVENKNYTEFTIYN